MFWAFYKPWNLSIQIADQGKKNLGFRLKDATKFSLIFVNIKILVFFDPEVIIPLTMNVRIPLTMNVS